MQNTFRMDSVAGRSYEIRVEEVDELHADLVRTVIEIDLQTFFESTFSYYTAAAFLKNGRVFLLHADDSVIGTFVCMRCWERPNEVMILSMGIRPGWRGKGLGQHFVMGVLQKLSQRGIRSVSLMIGEDNKRAIRVYQEVGFEVMDETSEDPKTGETYVFMRRKLQDDVSPMLFPG